MNVINTVKVELPDGTLLNIEGGNAKDTAHFLANRYLKNSIVTTEAKFQPPAQAFAQMVADSSEEEVLTLPVLNFAKPGWATVNSRQKEPSIEMLSTDEEEVLPLPRLD
jgi:hypothetical protein